MKYAIIDLEWSSKPYENIVQIGEIKFDEKNKEISRFYKVVRPSVQLRQEELDFMHLSADAVDSGIGIVSATKQFIFWLSGCVSLLYGVRMRSRCFINFYADMKTRCIIK